MTRKVCRLSRLLGSHAPLLLEQSAGAVHGLPLLLRVVRKTSAGSTDLDRSGRGVDLTTPAPEESSAPDRVVLDNVAPRSAALGSRGEGRTVQQLEDRETEFLGEGVGDKVNLAVILGWCGSGGHFDVAVAVPIRCVVAGIGGKIRSAVRCARNRS